MCFQCNISCDRDYEDDKVNSLIENLLSICILEEKEVDLEAAERYEMILVILLYYYYYYYYYLLLFLLLLYYQFIINY